MLEGDPSSCLLPLCSCSLYEGKGPVEAALPLHAGARLTPGESIWQDNSINRVIERGEEGQRGREGAARASRMEGKTTY